MKKLYSINHLRLVIFACFFTIMFWSQAFITTWITDNGTIFIPTNTASGPYNYNIVWENLTTPGLGNGSFNGATGNYTISGLTNGHTYQVSISGTFPHFYMNDYYLSHTKIRTIEQWGNIQWKSFENAFMSCSNLTYNATDLPNLSQVTNMKSMFEDCHVFNGNSTINNWNTSNITNMFALFYKAYVFNQPLNNWNTSNVTNMGALFYKASAFNQPLNNWNVSNVTNMEGLFYEANSYNQPIGNWNVSNVTNMYLIFFNNSVFNQSINSWDVSNVLDMEGAFANAVSYNQNLSNWLLNSNVSLNGLFFNSGIDCNNYSETLIGWANNSNTPIGRSLGAQGREYGTDAVSARNTLINLKGWTIIGDVAGTTTCTLNDQVFNLDNFQVYPNPVEDVLNINYSEPITTIHLVNVYGQKVLTVYPLLNDYHLDMKHLMAGVYFLNIKVGDIEKTVKVVKK